MVDANGSGSWDIGRSKQKGRGRVNRCRALGAVLAVALMACGCRSQPSDDDIDQAHESAQEQLSDASFEDVGDTSDCTEDCSGHEAGFDWARDEGVTDSSDCSGSSQSFVEGCEAYVSAVETQADDELETGEE
jgi:hypothetical protein